MTSQRDLNHHNGNVSSVMLDDAVDAILHRIKLDCGYDIPYLAGYSLDGKKIYIDRHLPKTFT